MAETTLPPDGPENLVLRYLRRIDESVQALDRVLIWDAPKPARDLDQRREQSFPPRLVGDGLVPREIQGAEGGRTDLPALCGRPTARSHARFSHRRARVAEQMLQKNHAVLACSTASVFTTTNQNRSEAQHYGHS